MLSLKSCPKHLQNEKREMKRFILRLCSRHGEIVSSKRPRDIEEDTTLATHVLLIVAGASHTGSAVHWGRVSSALRLSLRCDVDDDWCWKIVLNEFHLGLSIPGKPDVAALSPAEDLKIEKYVLTQNHCPDASFSSLSSPSYPVPQLFLTIQ